ncbi:hypothetical protein D918_02614 [Trichuris suis]|nr:hypothetical protein D918_02614 [Trichuris suis]
MWWCCDNFEKLLQYRNGMSRSLLKLTDHLSHYSPPLLLLSISFTLLAVGLLITSIYGFSSERTVAVLQSFCTLNNTNLRTSRSTGATLFFEAIPWSRSVPFKQSNVWNYMGSLRGLWLAEMGNLHSAVRFGILPDNSCGRYGPSYHPYKWLCHGCLYVLYNLLNNTMPMAKGCEVDKVYRLHWLGYPYEIFSNTTSATSYESTFTSKAAPRGFACIGGIYLESLESHVSFDPEFLANNDIAKRNLLVTSAFLLLLSFAVLGLGKNRVSVAATPI